VRLNVRCASRRVTAWPARAWIFRTHQRAVDAAREIAVVYGQPVDVVKLL
jgi:hypothetical protein